MTVGVDGAALLDYPQAGHYTSSQGLQIPKYLFPPSSINASYRLLDGDSVENYSPSVSQRTLVAREIWGMGSHVTHNMWMLEDLLRKPQKFVDDLIANGMRPTNPSRVSLRGEVAEAISRRDLKYWADNYGREEHGEPLLENLLGERKQERVVDIGNGYELRIKQFPNVVLMKSRGPYKEPECVGEFDGFFKYHNKETGKLHVFVLESKLLYQKDYTSGQTRQERRFKSEILGGLRAIYQDEAIITHVRYSNPGRITTQQGKETYLAPVSARIRTELEALGVPTLFFPFKEGKRDFDRIVDHIIAHAPEITEFKGVKGKASRREIVLTDEETGEVTQVLVTEGNGVWRTVPPKQDKIV